MDGPAPDLLLVSVGNSRTRCAVARQWRLEPSRVVENSDARALREALTELTEGEGDRAPDVALIASVNDAVADAAGETLTRETSMRLHRLGRDLAVPMAHALPEPVTVGTDRLLAALGAFSRCRSACVVIDAGTAVTVDFVDGTGVFQGGVIAPGLRMMLRALHDGTAQLPDVTPEAEPADLPFGRTTASAMQLGAMAAVRGLAHLQVDRYAEFYGAYPRVIATGGDAPLLFGDDQIIEHVVPDLVLMGMVEAMRVLVGDDGADDDAGA